MQIITSVTNIGIVTAVQMIIHTNEFKDIQTAKKFACYASVAPFKDESGLVMKKARVSHIANKKMKHYHENYGYDIEKVITGIGIR